MRLPFGSAERKALVKRSDACTARVCEIYAEAGLIQATSLAGLRAKAEMLRTSFPYVTVSLDRVSDEEHTLAWPLARDLLLEVRA